MKYQDQNFTGCVCLSGYELRTVCIRLPYSRWALLNSAVVLWRSSLFDSSCTSARCVPPYFQHRPAACVCPSVNKKWVVIRKVLEFWRVVMWNDVIHSGRNGLVRGHKTSPVGILSTTAEGKGNRGAVVQLRHAPRGLWPSHEAARRFARARER